MTRIGIIGLGFMGRMHIGAYRKVPDARVVAIADQDAKRASGDFSGGWGNIAGSAESLDMTGITGTTDFQSLIRNPDVDVVDICVPTPAHEALAIAALEAGKHVLCEKPFTANAQEARSVAAAAEMAREAQGLVTMEAFHYRYHPMTERILGIIGSRELGDLRHVETWMCIPLLLPRDIRWQLGLAGGALMDVGCYALHQLRTFAGAEPQITSATAKLASPGVDRLVRAQARFADGRTGRITASMASYRLLSIGARVLGSDGELRVRNTTTPQLLGRLSVRSGGSVRKETFTREPTYLFQLRAFAGAVLRNEPFPTGIDDAIANMEAIDACYRAAGLEPRQPTG
jgi:predicted dehydrogenase